MSETKRYSTKLAFTHEHMMTEDPAGDYVLYTDHVAALAPALTPKQEAAEEMFEALKDLEWANDGRCPQCSNRFVENHQPKCILAAALTKAGRS